MVKVLIPNSKRSFHSRFNLPAASAPLRQMSLVSRLLIDVTQSADCLAHAYPPPHSCGWKKEGERETTACFGLCATLFAGLRRIVLDYTVFVM